MTSTGKTYRRGSESGVAGSGKRLSRCFCFALSFLLIFASSFTFHNLVSAQSVKTRFYLDESAGSLMAGRAAFIEKHKLRNEDDLNRELAKLVNELIAEGYLSTSVDSIYRSNDTFHIRLHTGNRIRSSAIVFSEQDIPIAIAAGYNPDADRSRPALPGKTLAGITDYLNQNGFPLAAVHIDEMVFRDDTLLTFARIEKGDFYEWDTLEIKGDLVISNRVLQRLIRIRQGEPFNNKLLTEIDRHLSSLAFVSSTQHHSIILTDDGRARVVLYLEKLRASGFNGIIGFGPDKVDPTKLIFSGDMELKLANAFGQAEEISMKWVGIQGDQQLNISYGQPYLPGLPFGGVYSFGLFRSGELYYTLDQRGGIRMRSKPGTYITTYLQKRTSRVLDRSVFTQHSVLPPWADYSTILFGLEYRFQRVDFLRNPGQGMILTGDIAGGQKRIQESSDIPSSLLSGIDLNQRQFHGYLSVEAFVPLTERWILRPAGSSAWISSSTHHENELFMIGGINTIRGFDERTILASTYAIASLELRYRFEMESHFKFFFDAGWYEKRLQSSYMNDFPFGFGIGLAIPFPAGILQVSYAYGIQQGNPLDFRTGRLHFGLTTMF